jgi:hypothetical protein
VGLALVQVLLVGRDSILVAQAARDAARQAAVDAGDERVRAAALGSGLEDRRLRLEVDRSPGPGGPVTARVRYRAAVVLPFLDGLLPGTVELSARATMRQEVP